MPRGNSQSRIHSNFDLTREGRQYGDLQMRYSDNRQPMGFYPVPIACFANGDGQTETGAGI